MSLSAIVEQTAGNVPLWQIMVGLLASVGGVGGLVAYLRVGSQNRLDEATSRKADVESDRVVVDTARELIKEMREEMDRKVAAQNRELGRVAGLLESAVAERNALRGENQGLRNLVDTLRSRIESLEGQVRVLTTTAELAAAHTAADKVLNTAVSAAADLASRAPGATDGEATVSLTGTVTPKAA